MLADDAAAKMHSPYTSPKALPRFWLFCLSISIVLRFGYANEATNGDRVVSIGAIIDLNSRIGKEQKVAMEIAAKNYNRTSFTHKLALHFHHPTKKTFNSVSLAEEMIKNQKVEVIIGMHTWQEAALMAEVGSQAQVPVISFVAPTISPPLMPIRWPYLIRLANNATAFIKCIKDIVHHYSWRRVIAIYEDDAFGGDFGKLALLSEALQDADSMIEYNLALPPISSLHDPRGFVSEELIRLMQNTQSRVFVLLQSSPEMAIRLFREASKLGLVDRGSAWLIPEGITNLLDTINSTAISYMEGALGIKTYYSENSRKYQDFQAQFKKMFQAKNPEEHNRDPGFYALRAYDSIKIVGEAADRMADESSSRPKTLVREISSSNFPGLSGEIQFEQGQLLQDPIFRIVNVVGKSYKELDFWTQKLGFIKDLSAQEGNMEGLTGPVIWPGNLLNTAKGWNMPGKQNRMKIAVPGRTSFSKFVKVDYGKISKNPNDTGAYSGFCIEIFDMVRPLLGYDLPFDYIPVNGTYPDLVRLVYNRTYDAAIGDITILAERLPYVDFTVPYAESGLSMIVPEKYDDSALMFFKPFTWQLWLATGVILMYTMFIVWYLERESNPEFDGDWKKQISTALWFTFSSLFFAHREQMRSDLTRVVMVVWLFLVLIINSSYTASLSSMLTVQQLKPNVTDIDWLKRSNMKIGCDGDSFVRNYLEKVQNFKPDNILNISSEDNYVDVFNNNSIAAAFLELPYEKVFINQYCKDYYGSTPTTRFGGLGFMFQKGSPMVRDFSRAILILSENGELKKLEEKWLGSSEGCSNSTSSDNAKSLKFGSLWVLYLISGATSTICLLISTFQWLKTNWRNQNEAQEGDESPSGGSIFNRAVKSAKKVYNRMFNNEREIPDVANTSGYDFVSTTDAPEDLQAVASTVAGIEMTAPDHHEPRQ